MTFHTLRRLKVQQPAVLGMRAVQCVFEKAVNY